VSGLAKLIAALALLLAACLPAAARTIHIVAFGDSATAGWLVPHDKAYPAQLQALLRQKGYDAAVENAGTNGGTTAGALRRFDQLIGPDTDIALVEFGTNDLRAGASKAKLRARLTELIRALQARRIEVLLIGLGSLDLSDVAKINKIPYAQWRLPRGKYRARDRAHFNAQGYAILVARLLPQVEMLIKRVIARKR
jgi:lysophospholipase L1-like esterase